MFPNSLKALLNNLQTCCDYSVKLSDEIAELVDRLWKKRASDERIELERTLQPLQDLVNMFPNRLKVSLLFVLEWSTKSV